ncbi:AI-2E family transporter [Collinsella ihumii]|uniref:AI-2E family transporter n=1 Tax=Collinsella ihumii TaxID=1720204 RepID=A0ABT7XG56_9ACTN|nr:AI-2E family transporter [Collinsella ihumii]MDN0064351.1 AI-2E family transporter [Collinsella ihumii]
MNQPSIRTVVALAIAAFSVYLAIYYWPNIAGFIGLILQAVAPLVYGAVLAYPLNILMSFYERHMLPKSSSRVVARVRPGLSLMAALLTLVAVVAIVLRLVVPQLIDCVRLLIDELPVALQALFSWLEESNLITPAVVESVTESLGALDWQSHASSLATTVMSGVVGAVSGVVSGTATFVLAFIFALFILLNKRALARQRDLLMERYLPASTLVRVRYVLGIADDCFHRFLVGQCTEAVVLGALCALGMFVLGLPYALMIGALTAFTALIPIIGAFLSGAVGAFLILMVSPVQALIFLIFIVVLQQLEGDLIYPHVVGSSIQLPGIWVLAAVTVGGGAFGIVGMFVGVPLAACAYRLIKNDVYGQRR